jgi:hypothetical protein
MNGARETRRRFGIKATMLGWSIYLRALHQGEDELDGERNQEKEPTQRKNDRTFVYLLWKNSRLDSLH